MTTSTGSPDTGADGDRANGGQQQQQQQPQQNRYAHLVTSSNNSSRVQTFALPAHDHDQSHRRSPELIQQQQKHYANGQTGSKAPPLKEAAGYQTGARPSSGGVAGHHHHQQAGNQNKNYYYQSFSGVDWREQWLMLKEKTLEKVEEPKCQRKLIMLIVCTALLLDNMLYMVIVPIIPDYLRSIGSWSTYTENAKWVRRNMSHGRAQWEKIGGNTVYEGEDSAVGFLFASKAIVQLIANPFSGAIADRIGYEIPMMFGLIVMFLSTMVFACGQTYSVLFLARSLQGVGSAFADTPGIAMLADRFTDETERRRAQGIAIAFISFGCLVAPPFGSVLYQGAGKEVPFILLSLVCLIDGSLLLLVAPPGTFSVLWPSTYYNRAAASNQAAKLANIRKGADVEARSMKPVLNKPQQQSHEQQQQQVAIPANQSQQAEGTGQSGPASSADKKRALLRQKSISRRHSMTLSSGEAPKGTPIEVLLKDPCIACCAGALVVANISLAFLEPTISIWVKNTMPDTEEWQEGLIWLPAFLPHVLGVFATLHFAEKYPQATWKIAASGLVIEGLGCIMVPFCSSFWSLIIPISVICFGVALIDTAILPTLGYLVDTRFTSVYGNVYAIADISYSVSYAIGPIIAGGIVEAIGFTALNFLIAIVTLGYAPSLMMLRTVRDYQPFEADQTGRQKELAQPFGKFGRTPIGDDDEEEEEDEDGHQSDQGRGQYGQNCGGGGGTTREAYSVEAPSAAATGWASNSSIKKSGSPSGGPRTQKSVKIIESTQRQHQHEQQQQQQQQGYGSNPFQ